MCGVTKHEAVDFAVTTVYKHGLDNCCAYPLVVQTWVGSDSTCGSLCHNHHRTTAGPETKRADVII